MLIQLEPPRRARGHIVAEREVAVTIRIAPARSNVRRVEDVGIDELDVGANAVVPFRVPFFDVLAPEVEAFEELGAFGDFAAVFVYVFLLDELE